MIGRLLRYGRHPLRALALAAAAFCFTWGVAVTEGLVAAMLGTVLGLVVGERLGRTKLRTPFLLGMCAALGVVGLLTAKAVVSFDFVAELVGPSATLRIAGLLRYGLTSFATVAALRIGVQRRPSWLALELGLVVAGVATIFASHRDGVIARPLWLSDWAWQNGIDPTNVLLGVGGFAVIALALLLVAESKSDLSLASLGALIALAVLAVACFDVVGLPKPTPENDLNLTPDHHGEPPHEPQNPDAGRPRGGGNQHDGGRGGGSGNGGDGSTGAHELDGGGHGGGGGSSEAGIQDGGGASGHGEGGTGNASHPPPRQQQPRDDNPDVPSHSPAPMAVVIFDDDYSPPSQMYYFREEAWSEFHGPRLVPTTRTDTDRDVVRDFPTLTTNIPDPAPRAGRTQIGATVALLVEHNGPFGLETPLRYAPVANPNPQRFVRAYRFVSLAQTIPYRQLVGRHVGNHAWTPDVLAYYTTPSQDPRFSELAHRIVATLPARHRNDPFAQAVAVKLWLDENLTYSTRHRHAGVPDPTADFLFGDKTGYCVHFAHAAVFLWRSLGIPARIGTGYATDEANRHGGSALLVRGNDAHAWPEIYIDGLGWVILDISAHRNLDPPGQPPDDDLQSLLGEMARQQPPDPAQPEVHRAPPRKWGRIFGIGGLSVIAAILLLLYGIKSWRRLAPMFASARGMPRVGYRALLDVLGDAGLRRNEGESREAFATRLAPRVPSLSKLTAMHVAAKMRAQDAAPGDELSPPAWRQALRSARRELRATTKLWRRLLGLLHPTSFLDTH